MKTYEIPATYGSQQTPCTVFVCDMDGGYSWYCVEDSHNVSAVSSELLVDGVDVETLPDFDTFTTGQDPVGSLEELAAHVEEIEEEER